MGPRREDQQSRVERLAGWRSPPLSAPPLRTALACGSRPMPERNRGSEGTSSSFRNASQNTIWAPFALSISKAANNSVNIASFLREEEALSSGNNSK